MSDHLGAIWREYRTRVIPLNAPAVQATECRRAFYAGAASLLDILLARLERNPDSEPTPDDLVLMDDLHAELRAFGRAIQEHRA